MYHHSGRELIIQCVLYNLNFIEFHPLISKKYIYTDFFAKDFHPIDSEIG